MMSDEPLILLIYWISFLVGTGVESTYTFLEITLAWVRNKDLVLACKCTSGSEQYICHSVMYHCYTRPKSLIIIGEAFDNQMPRPLTV